MVIDKDIVEKQVHINNGYGTKSDIETMVYWLVKQVSRALLTR